MSQLRNQTRLRASMKRGHRGSGELTISTRHRSNIPLWGDGVEFYRFVSPLRPASLQRGILKNSAAGTISIGCRNRT